MKPAVFLNHAKQNSALRGHPWIFPNAIVKTSGLLISGELVDIFTTQNELIGVGTYNEYSLYRVRVLARAWENIKIYDLTTIISYRFQQAILLRQVLNLPNPNTTVYRLFNSEADGLSGLVIDRFNDTYVIASSAYWVEYHKETIIACLKPLIGNETIIWLPQTKPLSQDGWSSETEMDRLNNATNVSEAGVMYHVDFSSAQKTGLFIDQRDNHQRIADLAAGKRVLDLYTYTGGFALHAAKAGATFVTAVDSSVQAIEHAKANAKLNQLTNIEFIADDARNYLSRASEYDLIILDPPKLVPSQKHLNQAKNYYRFLHRELFKTMRAGTLLMTCNCSSALSPQEFANLVATQASKMGKQARLLGLFGPATCHPTLPAFPEGNYLSAVLLAIV